MRWSLIIVGLTLFLKLFGIELDDASDGSLANRTEVRIFVGTHATIVCRSINTLGRVASSFIYTYREFLIVGSKSRNRGVFHQHVLPFGGKVCLCSDILFPWLCI